MFATQNLRTSCSASLVPWSWSLSDTSLKGECSKSSLFCAVIGVLKGYSGLLTHLLTTTKGAGNSPQEYWSFLLFVVYGICMSVICPAISHSCTHNITCTTGSEKTSHSAAPQLCGGIPPGETDLGSWETCWECAAQDKEFAGYIRVGRPQMSQASAWS